MALTPRNDLIPIGEIAPDFTATTGDGRTVRLSDLRGRQRALLVFYPGDNTPVCTAQLCALRDDWSALQAEEVAIYGVNPANADKHARFAAKHQFPFPLIVDAQNQIAAAYGCRGLFGLVKRTVYILDRQGRVAFARRGNPPPAELLRVLHSLRDSVSDPAHVSASTEEA